MDTQNQTDISTSRHAGMFKPGQSGNPSGRPKADATIRELAKAHTDTAISTLAEIMNNPKVKPSTRVQAACSLLDRGWGKPHQYVESVQVGLTYKDFLDQIMADEPSILDA